MSRTLTLIPTGFDAICAAAASGRKAAALAGLDTLLARPDVPAALVLEGHRLAGALALDLGRFTAARRHLRTAAALVPTDAETRHFMGRAWEEDPDGCDRRAALCYRKATTLESANPLYRAAFGRAAARCGKLRRGIREMLAAADQAPGAVEVVRVVVGGLLEMGKPGAARRVLTKAQFLRPNHPELATLAARTKFESARLVQKQAAKGREDTRFAQDAQLAKDGDRVVLPFVRIADGTGSTGESRGTVRTDTLSFPRPHLGRLHAGRR